MPPTRHGRPFAALKPHCGVCRHVDFRGDWDRAPYCAERDTPTSVRVGDVCGSFELLPRSDRGRGVADEADVDVAWMERASGTEAPFYAVYGNAGRYGLLCGACWTLDAPTTLGTVRCPECDNSHVVPEYGTD